MADHELTEKIENIRKEFQALGSQISELASMSTDRLEEYRDEAMNEVREAIADTSQEAKKQIKTADEYVHKHPWAVVAGASVVGVLLGLLISKGKSKNT